MPRYQVLRLPIQLTDAEVRSFCDSAGILLAEGPEIGSDFVRIKTVEPIASIPALEAAIDEALTQAIGRVTELPD